MERNKLKLNDDEKCRARELLDELARIKGPEELPVWNIRAQAFLVFMAAKNPAIITEYKA